MLFVGFLAFVVFTSGPKSISYNQFLELVERGEIESLNIIGSNKAVGKVRHPDDPAIKNLELNEGKFTTVLPKMEDVDKQTSPRSSPRISPSN